MFCCLFVVEQLVSALGWAIFEALDYGCTRDEHHALSPDLEQIIDLMTASGKFHPTTAIIMSGSYGYSLGLAIIWVTVTQLIDRTPWTRPLFRSSRPFFYGQVILF